MAIRFWNRKISLKGREAGASKLTLIVFGLFLVAILYVAFEVIPFYYYYFELQNQMEAAVKVATTEDNDELRKKLTYQIRHMGLPVGSDEDLQQQLIINRDNGRISISMQYEEVLSISFRGKTYDLKRFPFYAHAERDL